MTAPRNKRATARKLIAIPALAAPALGALALPALAATQPLEPVAGGVCQAWQPVIPGLLSVGTAPLLTIGSSSLFGHGTCLPHGRNNNLEIGVNIAIPPGSLCAPEGQPPLLRVSLGLAVGPTDPDGYDPCQAATAPITPAQPLAQTPLPPATTPPQPAAPPSATPPSATVPSATAPSTTAPAPAQSSPPATIALPPSGHTPPPAPTTPPKQPVPPAQAGPPAQSNPPAQAGPPAPGIPPWPAVPPAVAAPTQDAAPARHAASGRPTAPPAARLPAPPTWMVLPRAEAQQQSTATFTPGKPVVPVGVLVTVVMTPCVATVAARLGRVLAGRA